MATTKQYAVQIRQAMRTIARKMGLSVDASDKILRIVASVNALTLAAVVKLLVDKGLVTNAELLAAMDAVALDDYAEEPTDPTPPEQ